MQATERDDRLLAVASLLVLAIVLAFPAAARSEIYYARDASGGIHFTNVDRPGTAVFRERSWPAEAIDDLPRPPRTFGPAVASGVYDDLIAQYAESYRIEPALVKAVMRAESAFRPRAISPKGARGLMQLMPATARGLGCRNVYDPEQNIAAGAKHLRTLVDQYGNNLPRVLAAYNAGAASVDRYRGIPPYAETRSYVSAVLRYRRDYLKQYRLVASGKRRYVTLNR